MTKLKYPFNTGTDSLCVRISALQTSATDLAANASQGSSRQLSNVPNRSFYAELVEILTHTLSPQTEGPRRTRTITTTTFFLRVSPLDGTKKCHPLQSSGERGNWEGAVGSKFTVKAPVPNAAALLETRTSRRPTVRCPGRVSLVIPCHFVSSMAASSQLSDAFSLRG